MADEGQIVALLDGKGKRIVLDDGKMRLVKEPWKSHPRTILELLLKSHSLHSFHYLLDVLVCECFNTGDVSERWSRLSRAKARFLRDVLGFDFRGAEVLCEGFTFRFFRFDIDQVEQIMGYIPTSFLRRIVRCNQYNISQETIRGKVVMDIGANVGVFSLLAARMGAEKVIAFEPVNSTYEILKRNIEINDLQDVILPVNEALGDKIGRGRIRYRFDGDDSATLDPNFGSYQRVGSLEQECEITTVDEFLSRQKRDISFVKIDSEGLEKEIIVGARETIGASKPLLSVCAYHHPDDVEAIPRLVLSIRDDYKYELLERSEKVLYFF